ncbi:nuclear transport factor 2 family protein [Pseudonocardia acaciae]|uniref:nuclear transport factor 2 family protein n=1 Tax=Pseudonocardia acaciae TaxID=551276 RepID=UPI00048E16B3|nr:nuclear transport factor 2 family protein [Pseudonocardia acaciae]
MPTNDTRAVVHELLNRMAGGDPDHTAAMFADSVDWAVSWPPGDHPTVPWIRPHRTPTEMADLFRELREYHVPERYRVSTPTILVDGPDAVVLAEFEQTSRATGRSFTSMFALRLTVRDGQVTRYHVYEDSLAIARAHAGS